MEFCTAKKNLIAASRAAGILALMLAAIFGWNMQAVFGQSQTGAGTTPLPPLIAAPGPYTAYTPPRSAANSSPAAPANQPAAPSYRPPQPKRLPTIAQPFNPADPFGGAAKTNSVSANPAPAQPAVPVAKPAPPPRIAVRPPQPNPAPAVAVTETSIPSTAPAIAPATATTTVPANSSAPPSAAPAPATPPASAVSAPVPPPATAVEHSATTEAPVTASAPPATTSVPAAAPSPNPPAEAAASTHEGEANTAGDIPLNPGTQAIYRIGVDDVLNISVWQEPDLSRTVPVRPDGKISLPLLGDVTAAGKTAMELQGELKLGLAKFVRNPELTVIVADIRSRRINVIGQVSKPGTFPLTQSMGVLEALAAAGGLRDFAKKKGIYVLRTSVDGKRQRLSYSYEDVLKGKTGSHELMLQPRDTVVVP